MNIEQILHWSEHPKEFIKQLSLQHPIHGQIPFKLKSYQEKIVDMINESINGKNQQHHAVLKSRQLGFTTISAAYAYFLTVFRSHQRVLFIGTNMFIGRQWLNKIKTWHETSTEMQELVKLITVTDTQLVFDNGSSISAISPSSNAARGQAASLVVMDEFCWFNNAKEVWDAFYPCVAYGGVIFAYGSVPINSNKQDTESFKHLWKELSESSIVNTKTFPWFVDETRDFSWYNEQKKAYGNSSSADLDCRIPY